MRALLLISLLLGTSFLLLAATTHSASPPRQRRSDDGATRAAALPPPIALEQPGNPPGLNLSRPPRRSFRSTVTYSRGPWLSIQANVDEFGNNIPNDAANEPSIAVHPNAPDKIAIGWRQFDTIDSNFRQAGWGYSQDGGQSWTFPGVIEPGVFRSDPVLGFSNDGEFYYYSLTTDFGNVWECHLFKSIDGGVSWDEGVFAFGGDKAWLAVDRTGGIGHGHIYAKWQTFFNCCDENTFTRSIDGGSSFEEAIPVPLGPSFGVLNVGPDGAVYVAGVWAVTFQDFDRIVMARSSDAQNPAVTPTFDLAVDVDLGGSLDIGAAPNPAGLAGQVWVATDHSGGPTHGNVYMLASVDPPGSDPLDVKFIRSTDGGQNWTAPIRVNDDPADADAWQWFGTISVAPNGRIDVIWNDTRAAGRANISELFYAYSTDAGDTWSPNMPVSPAFDSHMGWPNQNKLGDYYDMISDVAGVRIAYAATFNGEQDVYYLRLGDCDDNGIHDGQEIAGGASDDNANGILDVCESGACCLGDGTCSTELEEACLAAGGVYQQDGIDCGAVACAPFGACCAPDGTCSDIQPQADCIAANGMYRGDATDCASTKCEPFGACCAGDGSCADFQTQPGCDDSAGLYQGDATNCDSAGCALFGACCLPDESCLDQITVSVCDTASGSYQGDGSTCLKLDCTIPTGGCCMGDFSCTENTTEDDCAAAEGTYLGDGSDCTNCTAEEAACCDVISGQCVGDFVPDECVSQGYEPQKTGTTCAAIKCPIVQGACCLTDGNCANESSIPACEAAGGIFQGEGVACIDVDCAQPRGACCLENGDCQEDRTDAECGAEGGTFAGAGVDCLTADCPPPLPTGSCCLNNSVCVSDVTADACAVADGVYFGDDSDCTFCSVLPQACCAPITGDCADQPPAQCIDQGLEPQGPDTSCSADGCPMALGACCFETGFCLLLDATECVGLAGTWQGIDTTCANTNCSATGACCLANGDCEDGLTDSACAAAGGESQGPGSTCATANCPAPTGACCFDSGFCLDLLADECTGLGGSAHGPSTSCAGTACGTTGACCLADDNCLDVHADACAFLEGAYGGDGSTCEPDSCAVPCPEDLDGDGEVGPFDLALVLGFWGPCPEPCTPEDTCLTDLDGDCATGPFDLALILGFWGPCQ